jgi:hypothetical protein
VLAYRKEQAVKALVAGERLEVVSA